MENDFDYIDGEKFENLADISFGDIYTNEKEFDIEKDIGDKNEVTLVYCSTDRLCDFFREIKECDKIIDLISHNGDRNFYQEDLKSKPKNIRFWYSQNMMCSSENIYPLPIGLERRFWSKKFYGAIGYKNDCIFNSQDIKPKKNKVLYINCNVRTNVMKRQRCIDFFKGQNYAIIDLGSTTRDYNHYLRKIKESKFVLSPEGHGLDCHRTWEVLYTGSIPVLERNHYYEELYSDLPVLIVNNFSDITESFLQKEYERIVNSKWNMKKLKFSYWENLIKSKKEQSG